MKCPICKQHRLHPLHSDKCSKEAKKLGRKEVIKPLFQFIPDFNHKERGRNSGGQTRNYD